MKYINSAILITVLLFTFPQKNGESKSLITNQTLLKINSSGDEYSASISQNGETVIFSRKAKDQSHTDLYVMEYENNSWTDPVLIEELNSPANDTHPFLAEEGKMIFFSSDRKGSLKHSSSNKPSFDIYFSEKKDGKWNTPALVFGAVNTADDELNPSLSSDGKFIYFNRRKFDDTNSSKIVRAEKIDDLWKNPVTVKTPGSNYISPFQYAESHIKSGFYLTAYKYNNNRDIYFIPFDGREIKIPINAGKNINSEWEEIFICEIDKSSILISSNSGEEGNYNFFIKEIPESIKNFTKTGINLNINLPEELKNTEIKIKFLLFESEKPNSEPVTTIELTPENGAIKLITGSKIKKIIAIPGNTKVEDFIKEITMKEDQIISADLILEKKKDKPFLLKPVYFDFNSSKIQLKEIPYLHEVLEYMRNDESIQLLIIGYADEAGLEETNIKISIKRAEAVQNYFTEAGIGKNRFQVKGMGFKQENPLDTNQQNRRVEFSLIK